jgi:hypothetical protein
MFHRFFPKTKNCVTLIQPAIMPRSFHALTYSPIVRYVDYDLNKTKLLALNLGPIPENSSEKIASYSLIQGYVKLYHQQNSNVSKADILRIMEQVMTMSLYAPARKLDNLFFLLAHIKDEVALEKLFTWLENPCASPDSFNKLLHVIENKAKLLLLLQTPLKTLSQATIDNFVSELGFELRHKFFQEAIAFQLSLVQMPLYQKTEEADFLSKISTKLEKAKTVYDLKIIYFELKNSGFVFIKGLGNEPLGQDTTVLSDRSVLDFIILGKKSKNIIKSVIDHCLNHNEFPTAPSKFYESSIDIENKQHRHTSSLCP